MFVRNAQITKQLKTTNDLIEALEYEQAKSNENRDKLKLDKIQSLFLGKLQFKRHFSSFISHYLLSNCIWRLDEI